MALVPRWRVSLKARVVWTIFLAAYSAFVAVVVVLDRELKPTTAKWLHDETFLIGAVCVLAGLTFLDSTRRALYRLRSSALEKHRIQVRNQLSSIIVTVANMHEIDPADLGCGLFLIQARGIQRPERLLREERVRLIDGLQESDVLFTKGKGTVGECWANQRPAHHEWSGINRRYEDHPERIRNRWAKLPVSTTGGFTQDEFVSLLGKYSEVLAVPVMINGKFEGCIALDRRWNKDDLADRSLLNNEPTRTVLGTAATTLDPLLRKP